MSVDVKDHRRYLEGKQAEVVMDNGQTEPLLPQVQSELAHTGDPYLDKMLRAIEALIVDQEKLCIDTARKGIGCPQEDMFRLAQCEYMYICGKVEGLKEAAKIPARILAEARPLHSV
jgi:hypothetical protein